MKKGERVIEIGINKDILLKRNNYPIKCSSRKKNTMNSHYTSCSFNVNNKLNLPSSIGHLKSLTTVSDLNLDISCLKKQRREIYQNIRKSEREISLLQNKLKILSHEETKLQSLLRNDKESQKENLKLHQSLQNNREVRKQFQEEKNIILKEKQNKVRNFRIRVKKNFEMTKRIYVNNKLESGKESYREREKNEREIQKNKKREYSEKRKRYMMIKAYFEETQKRKIEGQIVKKIKLRNQLKMQIAQERKHNDSLINVIKQYQLEGLQVVERINTYNSTT